MAWVLRYVSRFAPTINDKNALCLVKAADGTACKHLMKWSPGDSNNKKGTGTTGLANQPHQSKAPHSVQGGHGAHRHKGGEERASGRGNR